MYCVNTANDERLAEWQYRISCICVTLSKKINPQTYIFNESHNIACFSGVAVV